MKQLSWILLLSFTLTGATAATLAQKLETHYEELTIQWLVGHNEIVPNARLIQVWRWNGSGFLISFKVSEDDAVTIEN